MKIVLYSNDPRIRTFPRFGGQDFFEFLADNLPVGAPSRGRTSFMPIVTVGGFSFNSKYPFFIVSKKKQIWQDFSLPIYTHHNVKIPGQVIVIGQSGGMMLGDRNYLPIFFFKIS
jgi:hypothetical protein